MSNTMMSENFDFFSYGVKPHPSKRKFEVPYNFCKEALVGIAFRYRDNIDTVYMPAYFEHNNVTRKEYANYPLNVEDYIGHVKFIQKLGLDVSILFQGDMDTDDVINFYLDNGVTSFIVNNDDLAIRIRELCPNALITASIIKQLSVEDIQTKDLSMYDRIVLDFRLNDLEVVKSLPKKYKYVLMPNCHACYKDCPKARCQKHWFDGENFENSGVYCHSLYKHNAGIEPDVLSEFDDYIEVYKLQGRELVSYYALYYITYYMDIYYACHERNN